MMMRIMREDRGPSYIYLLDLCIVDFSLDDRESGDGLGSDASSMSVEYSVGNGVSGVECSIVQFPVKE